jgi:small-conductance mechanosensitive channel
LARHFLPVSQIIREWPQSVTGSQEVAQVVEYMEKFDILAKTPWMRQEIAGNALHDYLLAVLTFIAVWWILLALRRFLSSRINAIAVSQQSPYWALLRDLVREIRSYFFPVMAFYVATRRLEISPVVTRYITIFCLSVLVIQAVKIASELLVFFLTRNQREDASCDLAARNTNRNIVLLVRLSLWSAGVLFILDNAGFNVGTFIAGLGIGGVAIALASQAILGDTFSSFAISLDKPFEPGDFIVVDDFQGTIEQIGLKTTRMRSLSGELLVFSNTDLCKSRLRNFKKMHERRVVCRIGVTYETSFANVKKIPVMLKSIVEDQKNVRVERVHFASYGDSALIYELVYYVGSREMIDYMDIQQEINFRIFEEFAKAGISMAYPTRTLHVVQSKADS